MPTAALGKPGADEFGLMARRIVHNDVDVETGRRVPLDFIKELVEFPRALARHARSDDRSRFHIESSDYPRFGIRVLIEG
jgi:hypothetical protein